MHLEIIFKDPNRKNIFIQNKNVMRGHPFLPSADLVYRLSVPLLFRHLLPRLWNDPRASRRSAPGLCRRIFLPSLFFLLPFFLLGYYLDPWINWSRHYLLLGSVAALFVLTYLVRLLFLHDPVVTWHPASGTLLKPFLSSFKHKTFRDRFLRYFH